MLEGTRFDAVFPPTYGCTAENGQLYLKFSNDEPLKTGWHYELGNCFPRQHRDS